MELYGISQPRVPLRKGHRQAQSDTRGYLGAIRAQRQSLKRKGDHHEDVTYPTGSHWVAATVVLSGDLVVAVHVIR